MFAGYLYFHNAPNKEAVQYESERLVKELHKFDVLRGDRSTAAHGLEIRVPFLDKAFVKYIIELDVMEKLPQPLGSVSHPNKEIYLKTGIEKHVLREAFRTMLPDEIFRRQKEAFSDGVGYTWVALLKQYANEQITDLEMRCAPMTYPNNTPLSKEEYLYRRIFEKLYPKRHDVIPHTWRPRWTAVTDPSATMLDVHKK